MTTAEVVSVADALKQLEAPTKCDYLKIAGDPQLIRFLDKNAKSQGVNVESVHFSDSVLKINKRGKQQKRDLVITTNSVYNFLPRKYNRSRRDIPIVKLKAIVLSTVNDEALIQVRDDYDYRLMIVRKADVIKVISELFEALCPGRKLTITFADDLSKLQVFKTDIVHKKRGSAVYEEQNIPKPDATAANNNDLATSTSAPMSAIQESLDNLRPIYEGWLTKKGVMNNLWRRRYFRLSDTNLLYYEARMKGSVIIDSGEVREWKNKRSSLDAAEHKVPTSQHHLRNILRDPERCENFMKFCRIKLCAESAIFYLDVEMFRATTDPAERHMRAISIYRQFLAQGSPQEISAPLVMREEFADLMSANSQKRVTNDMFDVLQQVILAHMKVEIFPQYLEYSRKKSMNDEDYRIKTELTEADKLVPQCFNCMQPFTLIKRRHFCRFCGDVFCSNCLSKTSHLPSQYGISEPVRVCDMCHGVLEFDNHPHTFSYISGNKSRPINLAAGSHHEMKEWIKTFNNVIDLQQSGHGPNPIVSQLTALGLSLVSSGLIHTHLPRDHEDPNSPPSVHREGWLMKEDPSTKMWHRQYCVLDENRLWLYELNLKGSLSLADGAGVHPTNEHKPTLSSSHSNFGGLRSESNFAYRFNVSCKDRLYALSADREEEMKAWIDSVRTVVRKCKPDNSKKVKAEDFVSAYQEEAPVGEVTFVFTDVQNSTKLWEVAPEAMNKGLEKHDAILRMLLRQFKGYEVKTEGDAFMVTFFNPVNAVAWCIAVQRALLEHNWPEELTRLPYASRVMSEDGQTPIFNGIRIRMGIHTGSPSCRRNPVTGRMDYFGPVVNRSARVADSAHGGQIICTAEVRESLVAAIESGEFRKRVMIADLGVYPYKGISEPVRVYQITSEDLVGRNPFPALRTEKAEKSDAKKAVNKRASAMHLSLPQPDTAQPEFSMTINSVTHAIHNGRKHNKRGSASEGSSHGEDVERKGEFSEMSQDHSQYDSEDSDYSDNDDETQLRDTHSNASSPAVDDQHQQPYQYNNSISSNTLPLPVSPRHRHHNHPNAFNSMSSTSSNHSISFNSFSLNSTTSNSSTRRSGPIPPPPPSRTSNPLHDARAAPVTFFQAPQPDIRNRVALDSPVAGMSPSHANGSGKPPPPPIPVQFFSNTTTTPSSPNMSPQSSTGPSAAQLQFPPPTAGARGHQRSPSRVNPVPVSTFMDPALSPSSSNPASPRQSPPLSTSTISQSSTSSASSLTPRSVPHSTSSPRLSPSGGGTPRISFAENGSTPMAFNMLTGATITAGGTTAINAQRDRAASEQPHRTSTSVPPLHHHSPTHAPQSSPTSPSNYSLDHSTPRINNPASAFTPRTNRVPPPLPAALTSPSTSAHQSPLILDVNGNPHHDVPLLPISSASTSASAPSTPSSRSDSARRGPPPLPKHLMSPSAASMQS